jgi:hypothetical protein
MMSRCSRCIPLSSPYTSLQAIAFRSHHSTSHPQALHSALIPVDLTPSASPKHPEGFPPAPLSSLPLAKKNPAMQPASSSQTHVIEGAKRANALSSRQSNFQMHNFTWYTQGREKNQGTCRDSSLTMASLPFFISRTRMRSNSSALLDRPSGSNSHPPG